MSTPTEEKIPQWHNPEGVTPVQLQADQGWRFLTVEEFESRKGDPNVPTGAFLWLGSALSEPGSFNNWSDRESSAAVPSFTYRTKSPLPGPVVFVATSEKAPENNADATLMRLELKPDQSLRTRIATAALQGLLAGRSRPIDEEKIARSLATASVQLADYLIEALNVPTETEKDGAE